MSFELTSGCWDFKAKFEDGEELVQRNIQIGNGSSYTWSVG